MADYSSNPGPDDNYGDAAMPASADEKEPHDDSKEEMDESPKGLLPKSILMGKEFKPGDEIVLKIDAIHNDEVEVSYATGKGDEGKGEEKPEMAPEGGAGASEGGDAEMRSMME